ncbi:hypothetical protein Tsp_08605 [Trichinella spiralis]|uniref:hypothetical protein n=1 Tax=Trichinella spiralis TaxID=6334 RepID=UPI0001EFDB33|nr:hypothetical protein Tsp_08605 [Trichinella spiralis]
MLLFWTKLFNARCLNVRILARSFFHLSRSILNFQLSFDSVGFYFPIVHFVKLSSSFVDWFDARNNYVRSSCVVCSVKFIWCDHRLTRSGLVHPYNCRSCNNATGALSVYYANKFCRKIVSSCCALCFDIAGCFKWLTARLRTYPKAPKLNLHTYRTHLPFHSGRVSTAMIREC